MAVTNFTANAIGDYFFAKLREPYTDVKKVLGYTIQFGVSSPTSIGTVQLVTGSKTIVGTGIAWTLAPGDNFIVGSKTFTVDTIVANTITTLEDSNITAEAAKWYESPDADNYFNFKYRWSQNPVGSDGGEMSPLKPLGASILSLVFDPLKPLYIDVQAEVERLSLLHTLSLISITFELETESGTIQSCPQLCVDCNDPYQAGCTNIVIDCSDPIYDPYNLAKPSAIYGEISELASEMWGHPTKYFRVEPDQRSKDVVLMEYSLYNVKEQGEVKIIVPDNAMPTREFQYDIFGMGFEDFEIHITKGQMEKAFGTNIAPRPRDYMYVPVMNRMYEISSVSFADEFNQSMTYWRVMLKKYEERTSTLHDTDATGVALEATQDALYTGVEEVFGEEIKDEYRQSTKPEQYQTMFSEVGDGIRERIHNSLVISDKEIRNKWTIIAKNTYDLEAVKDLGIECLVYKKYSQLTADKNMAFSAWFKPNFTSASAEQTLFDGRVGQKGFKLTVNSTHVKAYINDITMSYPFTVQPINGEWYGIIYNLNNTYSNTSANVYQLNPKSNTLTNMSISDTLINVMDQNFELSAQQGWVTTQKYSLMPGKLAMTNIRLYTKIIGKDQHTNMLQQYIVRDNRLTHIIDNAVPSIQLRKYNQNR